MSLMEMNWRPTDRAVRQFGGLCALILPLLGWWGDARPWFLCGLVLGGAGVAAVGWWRPAVLKPVFVATSLAAWPIGIVVGEITLLLVYWVLFVPLGLCFRLAGRDGLELRLDREASSYWRGKPQPRSVKSYYRQS